MVVPVLITSCHVSLNPNIGPGQCPREDDRCGQNEGDRPARDVGRPLRESSKPGARFRRSHGASCGPRAESSPLCVLRLGSCPTADRIYRRRLCDRRHHAGATLPNRQSQQSSAFMTLLLPPLRSYLINGYGRPVVPDEHGPDRPAVDDHRAVVRREAAAWRAAAARGATRVRCSTGCCGSCAPARRGMTCRIATRRTRPAIGGSSSGGRTVSSVTCSRAWRRTCVCAARST